MASDYYDVYYRINTNLIPFKPLNNTLSCLCCEGNSGYLRWLLSEQSEVTYARCYRGAHVEIT